MSLKRRLTGFFIILKSNLQRAVPILRIIGLIAITVTLIGVGSWEDLQNPSSLAIVNATVSESHVTKIISTNTSDPPTKTLAVKALVPTLTLATSTKAITSSETPHPSSVSSRGFASTPPVSDGWISKDEWKDAILASRLPHGSLYYLNDNNYLYLLVDLTGDTKGGGDGVTWSFDINRNSMADQGVDLEYYENDGRFEFCFYLQYDTCYSTHSKFSLGFGPSPATDVPHRYWEFKFSLEEIDAQPGESVRIGAVIFSLSPSFTDNVPSNLRDTNPANFADLIEFTLGASK